jgi:hypothetical protein
MHRFQKWREAIQGASNEADLHQVIRDYVACLPLGVVLGLPQECQDALAEQDVPSAAVTLLRCELTSQGSPEVQALLHEIGHTFAAANARLKTLKMAAPSAE